MSKRHRFNVIVDEDLYKEVSARLKGVDVKMSHFIEDMFINFVRATEPVAPLLKDPELAKNPARLRLAMMQMMSTGAALSQEAVSGLAEELTHDLEGGK